MLLCVVKSTHETGGGFGSIGYGCNFKRGEAFKNILRTHTTAVSAQMLYKLAHQEGGFTPQKYFSIDRFVVLLMQYICHCDNGMV